MQVPAGEKRDSIKWMGIGNIATARRVQDKSSSSRHAAGGAYARTAADASSLTANVNSVA
jgi:hypothetical protein